MQCVETSWWSRSIRYAVWRCEVGSRVISAQHFLCFPCLTEVKNNCIHYNAAHNKHRPLEQKLLSVGELLNSKLMLYISCSIFSFEKIFCSRAEVFQLPAESLLRNNLSSAIPVHFPGKILGQQPEWWLVTVLDRLHTTEWVQLVDNKI